MTPPPEMQMGLNGAETTVSLLGATAVCLILGIILRKRVPAAASSIERRPLVQKFGGGPKAVRHGRALLGWVALALFIVAGIAAEGTFIGRLFLWVDRTIDDGARHLPWIGQDIAGAAFSVVGAVVLWRAGHLVFDLLEGRAHHGGSDWVVFLAPTLFPLLPGFPGQWSTSLFTSLATHVGPFVAHL